MKQPIVDFVRGYASSGMARFHMPGHKGRGLLGIEQDDITEISGADSLYEAAGVIEESEKEAAALFGSARTLYSTEGSSQCVRAMVHLAVTSGRGNRIVCVRNAHRSFIYACALTGARADWLYPESGDTPLCACPVTPGQVREALDREKAAAVYLTSPDYLGGMQDIDGIARVCAEKDVPLLVDNAHGAYLRFLPGDRHPLTLGADLCCDSAHKTLPALTGAAWLHISPRAEKLFGERARQAMEVYGSTSPSYLTLMSLDRLNAYLANEGPRALQKTAESLEEVRETLRKALWRVLPTDPMRLTLQAPAGSSGFQMADTLRKAKAECEYADRDHLVMMMSPMNTPEEFALLIRVLGKAPGPCGDIRLPKVRCRAALSIREAVFAPWETVPLEKALGRICASPAAACPPAVPVVCAGEVIDENALTVMRYYGFESIRAVKE
ncbi:MAG: aminotransferase class V-fold PLP-dependent enzyme [Clostridia bacterium]|nr:aminotransferase class V-fold PLP-dependent enzyme [Clostridia bacterium]